jgi:hypothetical protein
MILNGVASGFSRKDLAAGEFAQPSNAPHILPAEAGSHTYEFSNLLKPEAELVRCRTSFEATECIVGQS